MESKNYDALIEALFESPPDPEEASRLLGEAAEDELEELAELVDTLSRIDPGAGRPASGEPTDSDFRAVRGRVLTELQREQPSRRSTPNYWLPLAAALAAFAIGIAAGRANFAPAPVVATGPLEVLTFTELLEREAVASASNANPDGQFRYSNVRLDEIDPETVAIRFDVATDLNLVRPKTDALVTDILASSLVQEESLGTRLKAVRYAGESPRLHKALVTAARTDPDVSVRLKALERLIELDVASTTTQETLAAVLADEPSVAMRLLAIEAIDERHLGADWAEILQSNPSQDGDGAVLWHAQQRFNSRGL